MGHSLLDRCADADCHRRHRFHAALESSLHLIAFDVWARPHTKDALTAERTVELFQEYNDAIVQTIHATEEFRSETNLRMLLLGMMIALTFGAGLEILTDPQSTPPSSPTADR